MIATAIPPLRYYVSEKNIITGHNSYCFKKKIMIIKNSCMYNKHNILIQHGPKINIFSNYR